MNKELRSGLIIAVITASLSIFGTLSGTIAAHFLSAQSAESESARQDYKNKLALRHDLVRETLNILSMKGHAYKLFEDVANYSNLVSEFSKLTGGKQEEFDRLLSYDEILNKKTREFTQLYGKYASTIILCKISFGPETKAAAEKIMKNTKWWEQDGDMQLLVSSMEKEFYYN